MRIRVVHNKYSLLGIQEVYNLDESDIGLTFIVSFKRLMEVRVDLMELIAVVTNCSKSSLNSKYIVTRK